MLDCNQPYEATLLRRRASWQFVQLQRVACTGMCTWGVDPGGAATLGPCTSLPGSGVHEQLSDTVPLLGSTGPPMSSAFTGTDSVPLNRFCGVAVGNGAARF